MNILIKVTCSVAVFSVFSAIILALIPDSTKLKQPLTVLSGLITVILLLPLANIDINDFDLSFAEQAVNSDDISAFIDQRITSAAESDIKEKSKPVLRKYGIDNARVSADLKIVPENGIIVKRVNYIISEGLSSGVEPLRDELCAATGYTCYVMIEEEQ